MAHGVKKQSQSQPHMILLGCGYTAQAMITPLRAAGFRITGTARSAEKAAQLSALGIHGIVFDGSLDDGMAAALSTATHLISSIPPHADGDPALRALGAGWIFEAPHLEWAGYLSATSVYGDRGGHWVFEDELLYPTTARGRARVLAELNWCESGAPVHIFRIAGIYGPEINGKARNAFARIKLGTAQAVIKPGHVSSRIHVYDIASAVLASIARPDPLMIYNLADDRPAPPQDVLNFAAKLLGKAIPQVDFNTADMSDMARSFYNELRRTSNLRAKTQLGWTPKYPSYVEGLTAIFEGRTDWSCRKAI